MRDLGRADRKRTPAELDQYGIDAHGELFGLDDQHVPTSSRERHTHLCRLDGDELVVGRQVEDLQGDAALNLDHVRSGYRDHPCEGGKRERGRCRAPAASDAAPGRARGLDRCQLSEEVPDLVDDELRTGEGAELARPSDGERAALLGDDQAEGVGALCETQGRGVSRPALAQLFVIRGQRQVHGEAEGTLAGDEIPIVDKKLDHYIGAKAAAGKISHLLIDRFRFDSFAPGRDTEEGSNLLTRFGHTVYLIFMVTPPPATVERAWLRGLQVGRYKAVDDLLDHNVEAFKGIPVLFFTWALRRDKTVYYEFLDNSVALKQTPRTIAFGLNREMYIIDFKCMLDIVRYTRININAENPDEVYPSAADMEAQANTDFLVKCARKIPLINFVDRASGQVYACMESGRMRWVDRDLMERIVAEGEAQVALAAMSPRLFEDLEKIPQEPARPVPGEALRHTLGDMG